MANKGRRASEGVERDKAAVRQAWRGSPAPPLSSRAARPPVLSSIPENNAAFLTRKPGWGRRRRVQGTRDARNKDGAPARLQSPSEEPRGSRRRGRSHRVTHARQAVPKRLRPKPGAGHGGVDPLTARNYPDCTGPAGPRALASRRGGGELGSVSRARAAVAALKAEEGPESRTSF